RGFAEMSRRPGPPSIDGLYSLKIDNISYQTTPQDLRRLFEKYGEIGDIHIPRDRYTKQSKGFGFVRYYSRRDAEYAMDRMDGRWIDGREIRVALARYERPIDERNARLSGYRSSRRSRSRSRSHSRSRSGGRRRHSESRSRSRSGGRSGKDGRDASQSRSSSPRRKNGGSRSRSASARRSDTASRSVTPE
uniref:RRM domain-containing protein n=1 Tax=Parascaris univalens TaxID=6257 RepID=A0A915BTT5_PARUN